MSKKNIDYETCMADAGLIRNEEKAEKCFRVIWEGESAGYVFAIIAYSLKDSPKFVEVCIDKDGVERGWREIDENGWVGSQGAGFPWYDEVDWKMPEGINKKGLNSFFQTQPTGDDFRCLYQRECIFLADIREGLEERLKDAKDEDERKEAVRAAKREAFNLGALDAYAQLSKLPQEEFWSREREDGGGHYELWELPDFCRANLDDFKDLAEAYNAGSYEGEAAAKRYNEEVLPRELEAARSELEAAKCETGSEFAEAERECDRTRTMECLDNYRMLKERMDSDECGWGASWWED